MKEKKIGALNRSPNEGAMGPMRTAPAGAALPGAGAGPGAPPSARHSILDVSLILMLFIDME